MCGCADIQYHAAPQAPQTQTVTVQEYVPEVAEPTKVRPIFPNFQHDAQGQPILTANEKLLIDDVSAIAQEADALRAGVETYNKWAKSHNAKVDAVVTPLSESQDTTFQKSVIHSIQLRGQ